MKKQLLIILTALLLSCSLTGCGGSEATVVQVNIENKENIHNTAIGKSAFVNIGNDLYYDSATRIVYFSNYTYRGYYVYVPYYAPNGLPYKYNPEINTFEEIENDRL